MEKVLRLKRHQSCNKNVAKNWNEKLIFACLSVCPFVHLHLLGKCPNTIYSLIFARIWMPKVSMNLSFHCRGFQDYFGTIKIRNNFFVHQYCEVNVSFQMSVCLSTLWMSVRLPIHPLSSLLCPFVYPTMFECVSLMSRRITLILEWLGTMSMFLFLLHPHLYLH